MAKSKLLKAGVKKLTKKPTKKPSGVFKKKAVNFDKFKQPVTKGERLPTKLKKKDLGFKAGAASGVAATYAAQKGLGTKKAKAKSKESPTKRMADDAYKKQKEKQKKYYDKKTERKRK